MDLYRGRTRRPAAGWRTRGNAELTKYPAEPRYQPCNRRYLSDPDHPWQAMAADYGRTGERNHDEPGSRGNRKRPNELFRNWKRKCDRPCGNVRCTEGGGECHFECRRDL